MTKHTPEPCVECSEQPKCKLHAAAPELLTELRKLVGEVHYWQYERLISVKSAEAAIAKAEGTT